MYCITFDLQENAIVLKRLSARYFVSYNQFDHPQYNVRGVVNTHLLSSPSKWVTP